MSDLCAAMNASHEHHDRPTRVFRMRAGADWHVMGRIDDRSACVWCSRPLVVQRLLRELPELSDDVARVFLSVCDGCAHDYDVRTTVTDAIRPLRN